MHLTRYQHNSPKKTENLFSRPLKNSIIYLTINWLSVDVGIKAGAKRDKVFLFCIVKPCQMRSKKRAEHQLSFLAPSLKEQLNPQHALYLLGHSINWQYFEDEFSSMYSDQGRPAHPIRFNRKRKIPS